MFQFTGLTCNKGGYIAVTGPELACAGDVEHYESPIGETAGYK